MTQGLTARLAAAWGRPNGYRDLGRISLPLIVSMGSHTLMLFTDRLFLGRYTLDALSAAVPAGVLAFMFGCFFIGLVEFTNTFVAQYAGARADRQVGTALWQGLYVAAAAGLLLAGLSAIGGPLFRWAGHVPPVRELEAVYFRILMQGAGFGLLQTAMSCFFSGRGLTLPIMAVNMIGVGLNIPLDYLLIFGRAGLPELGIAGSAIATVASQAAMLVLYLALVFRQVHERTYGVRSAWRPQPALVARLVRFGAPAGLQMFVDMFAFTFFLLMVGRLGRDALAASNIACSINLLAFMPMMGFSIAVSTLVGQAIGRGQPTDGITATRSALHLTSVYMWVLAAVFVLAPSPLVELFRPPAAEAADFVAVRGLTVNLLRFVACYSLLDALNVIYSGALRGAGDTTFIGWTIAGLSLGLVVLPIGLGVLVFGTGLYVLWGIVTVYVCALALVFRWRFRRGRWMDMRVIGPAVPPPVVLAPPVVPGVD